MVKIICCDIDGTLLDDKKRISEKNIATIKKAIESGIKFVLVSGRMPTGTKYFYSLLGTKGLYSVYNGGALYNEFDELLKETRLDSSIALRILSLAKANKLESILFDGDEWFLESKFGYVYDNKINIYKKECKIANFESLLTTMQTNKFLLMDQSHEKLQEFINLLITNGIDEGKVNFYLGPNFLELMPSSVTKGTAIDDLCSFYSIDKAEIMAIGDDYNDIPMLKKAGIAIAMGNAYSPVKEVATAITEDNNKDGVAKAIEKFCFKRR